MNKRHFLLCMWEGGGTVPPELGLARKLTGLSGARIRAELAVRDPADALLESLHHGRDISMPAFGGR